MAVAHHGEQDDHERSQNPDRESAHSGIDPPVKFLPEAPLDFLLAEHLRQRQAAKIIALIGDGVINKKTISAVIDFIERDLAQHIVDEELVLFPLLREKCSAEDKIDELLSVLAEEHQEDEAQSGAVLAVLRTLAAGGEAGTEDRRLLQDFADRLKRHLALENGVLLPLARSRLDAASLRFVAEAMLARRSRRGV